jgi:hypothetical protein
MSFGEKGGMVIGAAYDELGGEPVGDAVGLSFSDPVVGVALGESATMSRSVVVGECMGGSPGAAVDAVVGE